MDSKKAFDFIKVMDSKKAFDFIKGNLINIVVILTSLAYIFYGLVSLKKPDESVSLISIIAKSGIGIIVGLMIKQGVGENGFNKGYNSDIWTTSYSKYQNACNLANEYIDRVDKFYLHEEEEKKREYRKHILMGNRMRYDWFFDFEGNYTPNEEKLNRLNKKQKKALFKAVKVKIYNLNLFSEYAVDIEQVSRKEKTDAEQRLKMVGKNSLGQVVAAIVGAYFVPAFNGWNVSNIIIATIQVLIWVFCGVLQLYANYNYVVIEKVNKLTRKIELIIKFKNQCENGMYVESPEETQK